MTEDVRVADWPEEIVQPVDDLEAPRGAVIATLVGGLIWTMLLVWVVFW